MPYSQPGFGVSPRELDVQLVAVSKLLNGLRVGQPTNAASEDKTWHPQGESTETDQLVEFAGRVKYESFGHPNPRTQQTNAYVHHVLEMGQDDLLEHASATFYIRGLSHSAAQDLLDTSGLAVTRSAAPRSLPGDLSVVIPEDIRGDEQLEKQFMRAIEDTSFAYNELLSGLEEFLDDERNALVRAKRVHEAARAVMPQALDSPLLVTASVAVWRGFVIRCGSRLSNPETRRLAVKLLEILKAQSEAVFSDLSVVRHVAEKETTEYIARHL